MPAGAPILPPESIDLERVIVGREGIREWVPQRHEFEMLDAILLYDEATQTAVARKQLARDEFWVRGHLPGRPLFPGVLMIESCAQLCCFLFSRMQQERKRMFALGSVDATRFRGPVVPGDRLLIMARGRKIRSNLGLFDTQAFVSGRLVFEGVITGVVLPDR